MTGNIRYFMKNASTYVLWILVVVYTVVKLANQVFPLHIPIPFVVLITIVFGLLHGAMSYKWSGILTFIVICLVVSNLLENTSVMTGFPFGHYYYTDVIGPKLFLVPLLIGPSYCAIGYLAWVLGTVLIGDINRTSSAFTTFAVPFIASFAMVAWDLGFDPTASTINHFWIWEQGGGYFGVPLTNFLGWYFTVYVIFQLFALFLRLRRTDSNKEEEAFPRSFYAQAIIMYAVTGLGFVLAYLSESSNTLVTDAMGVVWHTKSIAEAEATVGIFTMIFVASLSSVKLLQRSAVATHKHQLKHDQVKRLPGKSL
ncbi:carotenoid biosynthesis protein [Neobacillus rhizophilus]|uniref:Carotenoid biosynthesis protein n=1 Tax=Neobacillus rhizophilus TaxID=2833579 RepID=A0A942YWF5_9BACI|nr:carotenoid biosynthesis protein [Neobacillus rhizophilus]MBS4215039.1 carotenoid biosynthesis protein [Neobacillus rhizophilus]